MSALLGLTEFYLCLTMVSMGAIIYTIPSLISTIRTSSQLLNRYKKLRTVEELESIDGVPTNVLNEWKIVSNAIGYTTLLTEEISKLNNLRPKFLIAEIGMILLGLMIVVGAYTQTVASCIATLLLMVAITIIYSVLNNKKYIEEYVDTLVNVEKESESSKNDAADAIYR
jgi:hypothetical protein